MANDLLYADISKLCYDACSFQFNFLPISVSSSDIQINDNIFHFDVPLSVETGTQVFGSSSNRLKLKKVLFHSNKNTFYHNYGFLQDIINGEFICHFVNPNNPKRSLYALCPIVFSVDAPSVLFYSY